MPARFTMLLFSMFIVCCREYPVYPSGGYDYPKKIVASDTNLYLYQLKDISTEREAFWYSTAWSFYRPFSEPNLSIQPQPKETFRFVYSDAFGSSMIITFNRDSLTVKKGNPYTLYKDDTTRLSAIENLHLRILKKRFPIDTTDHENPWQSYLDSMVKRYPQLLDPAYYRMLYDKSRSLTGIRFSPEVTKFPLTKQQYISIVQEINAAGFWTLPYKIECNQTMTDGYGFFLEVNTRAKYKVVHVAGCPDDSTKFTAACQKIIELAKKDKEFNLILDGSVVSVDSVEIQDIQLEPIKEN